VNESGYLVDQEGNIVNSDGIMIFTKPQLNEKGEFPKIFPFSKLKLEDIQGSFDKNKDGSIKIIKNKKG
jgi:hypothetical protein